MWKGLVHIRESEAYLSMGELLYNVIAVYIITVQIKPHAKFESHYNLLAVYYYLDHFLLSKFQNSGTLVWSSMLIILLVHIHCSKLFKRMKCTLLPLICNYY